MMLSVVGIIAVALHDLRTYGRDNAKLKFAWDPFQMPKIPFQNGNNIFQFPCLCTPIGEASKVNYSS